MKKAIIIITALILLIIAATAGYLKFILPNVSAAPEIKADQASERIANGKYLAHHVAVCMDCHSTRDWSRLSAPPVDGTLGQGGEYFGPEMGFPGKYYSKNLTSSHLGTWSDGEIFRAITSGVNKDGQALFPVMPYPYYSKLDQNDVLDIIAYIRTLAPIENQVPESESDFPLNFLINTMPLKPAFTTKPARKDSVAYGGYLATMAACMDCHSPVSKGKVIADKAFSGGREFKLPGGILRSANLTPDRETGLGTWTAEMFVEKFKVYSDAATLPSVKVGEYNTIMPWSMYAGMDTADLRSIFLYLKSLAPTKNHVDKFSPK